MLQHVCEIDPSLRILPEQLRHEVPRPLRHVGRKPKVHAHDPPVSVVVGRGLKWRAAHDELVGEDAEGPVVHPLVVGLAIDI